MKFIARALRSHPTDAERILWRHLRLRQMGGHKLRRQQPLGPYVVDFVCLERWLVIELDGGQHADQAREAPDRQRTRWLQEQGFCALRFWNHQVIEEIEAVKQRIWDTLAPTPALPREGGGCGDDR